MKNLFLLFCFLTTINAFSQEKEKHPSFYSMITLIANPEKYDGKKVSIKGFLKYVKGEEIRLFFSRDDLYYDNMKNCFVLYLDKNEFKDFDLSYYDGHYIDVVGYFSDIKHYYYGGAIEKITDIRSLDDIKVEIKAMEIEERNNKN